MIKIHWQTVLFVLAILSISSSQNCLLSSDKVNIDSRTQLRLYDVESLYSPNQQSTHIALFRDKLIQKKSTNSLNDRTQNNMKNIETIIDDPQIFRMLRYYIENQMGYIHIGAGSGVEDILIGQYIAQKKWNSSIYLFEPQPFSYILLQKNIFLNNLQTIIQASKTGISYKTNSQFNQLNVKLSDMGNSEITEGISTKIKSDYKINVNITKLDDIIFSHNEIGLIYLDVKLMVIPILMGMNSFFQKYQNLVMVVDWKFGGSAHHYVEQFIKVYQNLDRKGYKCYLVVRDHPTQRIIKFKQIMTFKEIFAFNEAILLFVSQRKTVPPIQIFQN